MSESSAVKPHLSREHLLELLRQMLRIRRFEETCAELYQAEKIRGFLHLYIGEEAVATGVQHRPGFTEALAYVSAQAALIRSWESGGWEKVTSIGLA